MARMKAGGVHARGTRALHPQWVFRALDGVPSVRGWPRTRDAWQTRHAARGCRMRLPHAAAQPPSPPPDPPPFLCHTHTSIPHPHLTQPDGEALVHHWRVRPSEGAKATPPHPPSGRAAAGSARVWCPATREARYEVPHWTSGTPVPTRELPDRTKDEKIEYRGKDEGARQDPHDNGKTARHASIGTRPPRRRGGSLHQISGGSTHRMTHSQSYASWVPTGGCAEEDLALLRWYQRACPPLSPPPRARLTGTTVHLGGHSPPPNTGRTTTRWCRRR